jgi:hypothetical protein
MSNIIKNRTLSDIVEAGSTQHGNYVKYRNGVMECWGTTTFGTQIDPGSTYSPRYYATANIIFPMTFQIAPVVVGSVNTEYHDAVVHSHAATTTTASLTAACNRSIPLTGLTATWQVIGKWSSAYDADVPTISIGRGIIESGSTPTGSYIKYEDGTMECWITGIGLPPVAINSGTSAPWTFPAPFASPPAVSHCTVGTSSGNVSDTGTAVRNGVYLNGLTNSSVSLAMWAYQSGTSTTVHFNMRAIGRWQSATNMVGDYTYGQGIVETGSNSNGNWIKFDNGTMMQWGSNTNSSATSFADGVYSKQHNFNLPASFISTSYSITASASPGSSSYSWVYAPQVITTSQAGCYMWSNYNYGSAPVGVLWQAIGRWK